MAIQLSSLQHALSLSVLNNSLNMQAASAAVMLQDFQASQPQVQAPHPNLGQNLDVRV
ncbi:putative motility protein [Marinicrinis lubricantis]|uniref:Motility protein n=1 Tax=Marinicrinis lubricantis TaxID=2086470 RepID=A0ABW1IWC1_9BACL